jgi:hypothetical protein
VDEARLFVDMVGYYTWAGAVVAGLFLLVGIDRIDPSARGTYLFRLLLIPGVVGLWPLVLWRWASLIRGGGHT